MTPDEIASIRGELEARPTGDLISILRNRDEEQWRPEVFDIVGSILASRGESPAAVSALGPEGEDVLEGQQLVAIGQYFSPIEAHANRMALEAAGLKAWVSDESTGTAFGVAVGSRLQVRVEDEEAACAALAAASPDLEIDVGEPLAEPTEEEGWVYAGFGDRLLGDWCDIVIAALVALPFYVIVDRRILGRTIGLADESRPFGAVDVASLGWCLWNLTYLVGKTGQSWGRKIAGVKVVGLDDGPIGFWRSLARNVFAALVSAPLLYLGFLWVLWDPQKRAWHDIACRTFVKRRVSD